MSGQGNSQTLITEEVEIVGTIKAASGLQIDGKLNGDLNCAGDVVVGQSAVIKGNLAVSSVTVHGQIQGNIVAKDRIGLMAQARVNGDIKAKRLMVEDGVSLVGKAEVNPSAAAVGAARASGQPSSDGSAEDNSAGGKLEDGDAQAENRNRVSMFGRK